MSGTEIIVAQIAEVLSAHGWHHRTSLGELLCACGAVLRTPAFGPAAGPLNSPGAAVNVAVRHHLAEVITALLADHVANRVPVIRVDTSEAAQELVDWGWNSAAARALTDLADDWDRDAAEESARERRDDVRCYSPGCNLRWAERQEYSCYIPGRAHTYDEAELAEASRVKIEPTYQGNEFRQRAAQILAGSRPVLSEAQIKAEARREVRDWIDAGYQAIGGLSTIVQVLAGLDDPDNPPFGVASAGGAES